MILVKKDQFNLKIQKNFDYSFEISEDGIYGIEITASAKSWWQNLKSLKSFFNDDDLALKIDTIEFPKLNGKRGSFDGEAAWNGNNLKGLSKTVVAIISLKKGTRTLSFFADQSPELESINIFKIGNEIEYFLEDRIQPQDGERRQWMTVILKDLSLKHLAVSASAGQYEKNGDDDDMKIIIDSQIQENETDKSHKNWYWCGRVLQGQRREFDRDLNLEAGLHYIELWADRKPRVNTIKIILDQSEHKEDNRIGYISLHKDIEEADSVNMRESPEKGANIVTQIENGQRVEIVKEVVEGEYIQNKSNIWHKIKYNNSEGYALSSYIEIAGQTRDEAIEKIKNQARMHGINEDYAVALAGCESRYKPYAVSYSGALGIFQLTSIARQHLKEKLGYKISDEESFNADKNIGGGIIYLQWLFGIYRGTQDEYKKVTAAWNVGSSLIPKEGPISFDGINDSSQKKQAQELVRRVDLNREKKNWSYILTYVFVALLLAGFSVWHVSGISALQKNEISVLQNKTLETITYDRPQFIFNNPHEKIKSIQVSTFHSEDSDWQTSVVAEYEDKNEEKIYNGFLDNAYLFNAISFTPQLFVVRQEGEHIITSVLNYNKKSGSLKEISFIDKDNNVKQYLCCSYIIFKPIENGVQYDLAVRDSNHELVYGYDFLEKDFFEKRN